MSFHAIQAGDRISSGCIKNNRRQGMASQKTPVSRASEKCFQGGGYEYEEENEFTGCCPAVSNGKCNSCIS